MTKQEIIDKWGKKDGYDDDRYNHAVKMAAELDYSQTMMFPRLIKFEDKGLIKFVEAE